VPETALVYEKDKMMYEMGTDIVILGRPDYATAGGQRAAVCPVQLWDIQAIRRIATSSST